MLIPLVLVHRRFNCSFTNVRSMIGESTDFSSQTVAMGYLGTAFGVGVILGPLIGGALAYPCDNFGTSFPLCNAHQLNAERCGPLRLIAPKLPYSDASVGCQRG